MNDPVLAEASRLSYREEMESLGTEVTDEFDRRVAEGENPGWVAMLLSHKFPSTVTDKQFVAGIGSMDQQVKDPQALDAMAREYERHTGRKPGRNMVYMPSLVPTNAAPGHPDAWLDSGNVRSGAIRVAEKQNVPLEGRINRKAREVDPTPDVPIAPSIVKRLVRYEKLRNPGLNKSDTELGHEMVEKHGLKKPLRTTEVFDDV